MARILVAEQDPQARHFLSRVLELDGHEVVGVGTGEQALRVITRERVDVAVTELRLPGLTGAGLVRAAGRLDEHLPCLVLGGFRDLAAIDEALEAGAVGVIPKPATPTQVLFCVARAYERRLLAREAVRGRLFEGLVEAWMSSHPPSPPLAHVTVGRPIAWHRSHDRSA
jgi:two-component system response regulator FlrC